jgi:hypothetical protein
MSNDVTLPAGGSIIETLDQGGGVQRQVVTLGSIGHAGAETQLAAGQQTATASLPVVLNSDPDVRPGASNITAADIASASAAGQDGQAIITGAPTAGSFQQWALNGTSACRLQISGTWVGTLQFEGSIDGGTTFYVHPARVCATSLTRVAVTANGLFDINVAGLTHLRVRATAWASGTATVQPTFSDATLIAPPSGVPVDGQRSLPILKGPINNGQATYSPSSGNLNIGGLITVATGLPPGTILTALILRVIMRYVDYTGGGQPQAGYVVFFDGNPSASTFADNTAQSLAAADKMKAVLELNNSSSVANSGSIYLWTFNGPRIAVDQNGNIYFSFSCAASMGFSGTDVLWYELDGTY